MEHQDVVRVVSNLTSVRHDLGGGSGATGIGVR